MNNEIKLDLQRGSRIGLGEAIFCSHKSYSQLCDIIESLQAAQQSTLFTRLEKNIFERLAQHYPGVLKYDEVAKTAVFGEMTQNATVGEIAIVTAGSSDVSVAKEALSTLAFFGQSATEIHDVGVAGLWRLLERLDTIKSHRIVICLAGMDAALPTVLGGLIGSLIIAVPTSVGYGMAQAGQTALNALLSSCASGLVVVNINNGYGAACAAIRALGNSTSNQ